MQTTKSIVVVANPIDLTDKTSFYNPKEQNNQLIIQKAENYKDLSNVTKSANSVPIVLFEKKKRQRSVLNDLESEEISDGGMREKLMKTKIVQVNNFLKTDKRKAESLQTKTDQDKTLFLKTSISKDKSNQEKLGITAGGMLKNKSSTPTAVKVNPNKYSNEAKQPIKPKSKVQNFSEEKTNIGNNIQTYKNKKVQENLNKSSTLKKSSTPKSSQSNEQRPLKTTPKVINKISNEPAKNNFINKNHLSTNSNQGTSKLADSNSKLNSHAKTKSKGSEKITEKNQNVDSLDNNENNEQEALSNEVLLEILRERAKLQTEKNFQKQLEKMNEEFKNKNLYKIKVLQETNKLEKLLERQADMDMNQIEEGQIKEDNDENENPQTGGENTEDRFDQLNNESAQQNEDFDERPLDLGSDNVKEDTLVINNQQSNSRVEGSGEFEKHNRSLSDSKELRKIKISTDPNEYMKKINYIRKVMKQQGLITSKSSSNHRRHDSSNQQNEYINENLDSTRRQDEGLEPADNQVNSSQNNDGIVHVDSRVDHVHDAEGNYLCSKKNYRPSEELQKHILIKRKKEKEQKIKEAEEELSKNFNRFVKLYTFNENQRNLVAKSLQNSDNASKNSKMTNKSKSMGKKMERNEYYVGRRNMDDSSILDIEEYQMAMYEMKKIFSSSSSQRLASKNSNNHNEEANNTNSVPMSGNNDYSEYATSGVRIDESHKNHGNEEFANTNSKETYGVFYEDGTKTNLAENTTSTLNPKLSSTMGKTNFISESSKINENKHYATQASVPPPEENKFKNKPAKPKIQKPVLPHSQKGSQTGSDLPQSQLSSKESRIPKSQLSEDENRVNSDLNADQIPVARTKEQIIELIKTQNIKKNEIKSLTSTDRSPDQGNLLSSPEFHQEHNENEEDYQDQDDAEEQIEDGYHNEHTNETNSQRLVDIVDNPKDLVKSSESRISGNIIINDEREPESERNSAKKEIDHKVTEIINQSMDRKERERNNMSLSNNSIVNVSNNRSHNKYNYSEENIKPADKSKEGNYIGLHRELSQPNEYNRSDIMDNYDSQIQNKEHEQDNTPDKHNLTDDNKGYDDYNNYNEEEEEEQEDNEIDLNNLDNDTAATILQYYMKNIYMKSIYNKQGELKESSEFYNNKSGSNRQDYGYDREEDYDNDRNSRNDRSISQNNTNNNHSQDYYPASHSERNGYQNPEKSKSNVEDDIQVDDIEDNYEKELDKTEPIAVKDKSNSQIEKEEITDRQDEDEIQNNYDQQVEDEEKTNKSENNITGDNQGNRENPNSLDVDEVIEDHNDHENSYKYDNNDDKESNNHTEKEEIHELEISQDEDNYKKESEREERSLLQSNSDTVRKELYQANEDNEAINDAANPKDESIEKEDKITPIVSEEKRNEIEVNPIAEDNIQDENKSISQRSKKEDLQSEKINKTNSFDKIDDFDNFDFLGNNKSKSEAKSPEETNNLISQERVSSKQEKEESRKDDSAGFIDVSDIDKTGREKSRNEKDSEHNKPDNQLSAEKSVQSQKKDTYKDDDFDKSEDFGMHLKEDENNDKSIRLDIRDPEPEDEKYEQEKDRFNNQPKDDAEDEHKADEIDDYDFYKSDIKDNNEEDDQNNYSEGNFERLLDSRKTVDEDEVKEINEPSYNDFNYYEDDLRNSKESKKSKASNNKENTISQEIAKEEESLNKDESVEKDKDKSVNEQVATNDEDKIEIKIDEGGVEENIDNQNIDELEEDKSKPVVADSQRIEGELNPKEIELTAEDEELADKITEEILQKLLDDEIFKPETILPKKSFKRDVSISVNQSMYSSYSMFNLSMISVSSMKTIQEEKKEISNKLYETKVAPELVNIISKEIDSGK